MVAFGLSRARAQEVEPLKHFRHTLGYLTRDVREGRSGGAPMAGGAAYQQRLLYHATHVSQHKQQTHVSHVDLQETYPYPILQVSLEESEAGFPLRAPSEWSSQV